MATGMGRGRSSRQSWGFTNWPHSLWAEPNSDKREKFLGIFFSYFLKSFVRCTLHLKIKCLLIYFRCRQVDIGSTVLSQVSLTLVNSFSAVSLTLVMNFRLFSYFWPVVRLSLDRMGPLGKPPASLALLPQEPVPLRAVALHSSNSNAGMKQYKCGRTQPLLWSKQWSTGNKRSKPKGLWYTQNTIINNK